jgi:cysteine desulfurase / selenocysteine lyase
MRSPIYLNNAGAGIPSLKTLSEQIEYLRLEAEFGAIAAANRTKDKVQEFYRIAAELVGANDSEIAYVDSASRAWDAIIYGIHLQPGDEIITLSSEFGTNLVSLFHRARQSDITVRVVDCGTSGEVAADQVASAVSEKTRAIALSHVTAHGAIVNPVAAIGQIAKERGLFYLVDGCHALGQLPVDVAEIQCDAYTTTGRKWLRGPRGTGFLYVRSGEDRVSTPFVDLASADLLLDGESRAIGVDVRRDAKQFELWERSVSAMLGLRNALIEYRDEGVERTDRIGSLATRLARGLSEAVPGIEIVGSAHSQVGIVGVIFRNGNLGNVTQALDEAKVAYSVMADWDAPIHFSLLQTRSILRLSPHYYNTEDEIDFACELIAQNAGKVS